MPAATAGSCAHSITECPVLSASSASAEPQDPAPTTVIFTTCSLRKLPLLTLSDAVDVPAMFHDDDHRDDDAEHNRPERLAGEKSDEHRHRCSSHDRAQ